MVHCAGQRLHFVHTLGIGLNTAILEHALENGAYSALPDHAWSTWMHAYDVVFFSPTGHQLLNVCILQGFIKDLLNVVGRSSHDSFLQFCAFHF